MGTQNEIEALRKENEQLKRIIVGKFDPDEYVDIYNKLIKEESMQNSTGWQPHENI